MCCLGQPAQPPGDAHKSLCPVRGTVQEAGKYHEVFMPHSTSPSGPGLVLINLLILHQSSESSCFVLYSLALSGHCSNSPPLIYDRAAICANKKSESLGEGAFRNKSKQNFKKVTLNHTYSLYLGPSPSTDLQPFSTAWNLLDYPLYLCSS